MTIQPQRLLDGPAIDGRPEPFDAHLARLGELRPREAARDVVEALEASGLRGRGGAGFPTGRKWRAMAERRGGSAVVVANGAEGEPGSFKDRVLMAHRPHLVIDGAILAAEAIGADEIVFYVGVEHEAAARAMRRAIEERGARFERPMRIAEAPVGYVAGEASAAVHWIDSGDARPTTTPPRVSERGIGGRPTLVQNVETLASTALIARFGDAWYRSAGRAETRGTALITVSGADQAPTVTEVEIGTTIGEIARDAGVRAEATRAVIAGGYFGAWAPADAVWDLPLDPVVMAAAGLAFGCGLVGFLPADVCGLAATAKIMAFMADESVGQCGPCVHGLRAIADATGRLAAGRARADDLARVELLAAQTSGRGACHHPDGAVQLLTSAFTVFGDEFTLHAGSGQCSVGAARVEAA